MENQLNPLPARRTHRLNLDSEQEQQRQQQQRLQRQQYQKQKEQKRKRKQQRRKAKQQEERLAKQAAEKKEEEKKKQIEKYNAPALLFQPDSDSGVSFSRLKRKIQQMYPKYAHKKPRNQPSSSEEDQSEEEQSQNEQSQSDSQQQDSDESRKKKSKKNKRSQRKRNNQSDDQQNQQRKKNKSTVKIQPEMSAKDKLVQQVAVRWNYALPQWPPNDYNYDDELKLKGYRNVEFAKFKFVDEVVDGLTKVYELDGFKGVYRGKFGLIDVRPKSECPSLNYFYSRSQQQLNKLLKKALSKQLQCLQNLQYKQSGQQKLLEDLRRRVKQLVK